MAALILIVGKTYLLCGAAVAVAFLGWGVERIEPNAKNSWVFRPLLVPGTVLLWPLIVLRWRRIEKQQLDPCARHLPPRGGQDIAAILMACLIPVIIFGALVLRQDGPVERPAVMLEAPK